MDTNNKPLLKDGSLVLSGLRLKELRRDAGLSQEGVVRRCSEMRIPLSIASLKRAERERSIRYRTARTLAQFYNVRIEDLLPNSLKADESEAIENYSILSAEASISSSQTKRPSDTTNGVISKILIVDDHAIFRDGLLNTILSFGETYVVLQASTLESALSIASRDSNIDLVLLDMKLPDSNGLSGFYRLQAACPVLPIALLSATEDKSIMIEAIQNGAQGYIHKSIESAALKEVLALILSGNVYITERIANQAE